MTRNKRFAILALNWFLSMMILLVIVISCERNESACWECTVHTIQMWDQEKGPYKVETVGYFLFCGTTETRIKEWIRHNSYKDEDVEQFCKCYRK